MQNTKANRARAAVQMPEGEELNQGQSPRDPKSERRKSIMTR